jgi:hypothetical protein
MVELATLQAFSYIMGSIGGFVAAVYYVLNIQNNQRNQELSLKAHSSRPSRLGRLTSCSATRANSY